MTTPATQSNNALGKRSLPSSLFAPLQTLGRYMDGQRDDRQKRIGLDPAGDSADGQVAGGHDPQNHSDEGLRADDDDNTDGTSWPDWTDSADATSDTSADASSNTRPDPDAVRSVISRLAREAQLQQPRIASGKIRPDAAGTEATEFAAVARRVWGETGLEVRAASGVLPASESWENPAFENPTFENLTHKHAALEDTLPKDTLPKDTLPKDTDSEMWAAARLDARTPGQVQADPPRLHTNLSANMNTGLDQMPHSVEAHALAHDASNLLSALRLYSELLCFSGVLHERHRHYAEDLKLLSLRSERLIDRLLQLAEQVAAVEFANAAIPVAAAIPAHAPAKTSANTPVALRASAAVSTAFNAPLNAASARVPIGPVEVSSTAELIEPAEVGITLADILMRTRGLLGTIAGGALVVDMGPRAGLPVAATVETLERVLVNLVSNAASAIREGGAIRVRAGMVSGPAGLNSASDAGSEAPPDSATDSTVVLTVDDSGCGMSEAQLQSVLGAPGYGDQGHGSHDQLRSGPDSPNPHDLREEVMRTPGDRRHGLGLSIVRDLVRVNGGTLFIQSRPGTGTRVEIHWRAAAQSQAAQSDAAQSQAAQSQAAQSDAAQFDTARPALRTDVQELTSAAADPRKRPVLSAMPRRAAAFPDDVSGLVSGRGIPQQPEYAPAAQGAVA